MSGVKNDGFSLNLCRHAQPSPTVMKQSPNYMMLLQIMWNMNYSWPLSNIWWHSGRGNVHLMQRMSRRNRLCSLLGSPHCWHEMWRRANQGPDKAFLGFRWSDLDITRGGGASESTWLAELGHPTFSDVDLKLCTEVAKTNQNFWWLTPCEGWICLLEACTGCWNCLRRMKGFSQVMTLQTTLEI